MEIWKKFTNLSKVQKEMDNFSLFFLMKQTNESKIKL